MKSPEARFLEVKRRNPLFSNYICLWFAVKKQGFTRSAINRWFNRLVEKDDYSRSDKISLLNQLEETSQKA